MVLSVSLSCRISPRTSTVIFFDIVAVGHGNGHIGNVTYLCRKVTGHLVHLVGQIFPRTGYARYVGLTAELSFRSHLAGHARYFRCEAAELVHHRVDRVLSARGFHPARPRVILLRQVAVGHGRCYFGNVTHLAGEVATPSCSRCR